MKLSTSYPQYFPLKIGVYQQEIIPKILEEKSFIMNISTLPITMTTNNIFSIEKG
jgi:hypothetical protein